MSTACCRKWRGRCQQKVQFFNFSKTDVICICYAHTCAMHTMQTWSLGVLGPLAQSARLSAARHWAVVAANAAGIR